MLHGHIEVNGQKIGYWEAHNVDNVFKGMVKYDCKVYYRNQEGHPMHAEFPLTHWAGDGAVALAYRVLAYAHGRMKGYPPGQPTEFPV